MNSNISVKMMPEASQFLESVDDKTRKKVFFHIRKTISGIKGDWFRKMSGSNDLYEFRTLHNKNHIRLFAFWDKTGETQPLIICTHGIIKKTGKTPLKEIKKAESLMKRYFEDSK